jgi:hypothetical protein
VAKKSSQTSVVDDLLQNVKVIRADYRHARTSVENIVGHNTIYIASRISVSPDCRKPSWMAHLHELAPVSKMGAVKEWGLKGHNPTEEFDYKAEVKIDTWEGISGYQTFALHENGQRSSTRSSQRPEQGYEVVSRSRKSKRCEVARQAAS